MTIMIVTLRWLYSLQSNFAVNYGSFYDTEVSVFAFKNGSKMTNGWNMCGSNLLHPTKTRNVICSESSVLLRLHQ